MRGRLARVACLSLAVSANLAVADDITWTVRTVRETPGSKELQRVTAEQTWRLEETAFIVCDVWDLHHSRNAVRRLEEFAPRLNDVLTTARRRGAIIIHAPSDCMPAYAGHPARQRAAETPPAADLPAEAHTWCSRIPAEHTAIYPIDQSDGGDDDDPAEHRAWAEHLKQLGRNPGTPWLTQSSLITIDADRDYITDRGDEVWNILRQRGVRHVVLTGVHTNMCVLGRPFGLRQMVRNGMPVVLMRDMTDCMYNPDRWPFVDHFTGNDLVIAYVERFICPTVTSDQILGGSPFRSRYDTRPRRDVLSIAPRAVDRRALSDTWTVVSVPASWEKMTAGTLNRHTGPAWYRCAVRVPRGWVTDQGLTLSFPVSDAKLQAWWNGRPLPAGERGDDVRSIPPEALTPDDAHLLVVRVEHGESDDGWQTVPAIQGPAGALTLKGQWQLRLSDDPAWSNLPLPAKFGASPEILFELPNQSTRRGRGE